jgi:hypothetical protein
LVLPDYYSAFYNVAKEKCSNPTFTAFAASIGTACLCGFGFLWYRNKANNKINKLKKDFNDMYSSNTMLGNEFFKTKSKLQIARNQYIQDSERWSELCKQYDKIETATNYERPNALLEKYNRINQKKNEELMQKVSKLKTKLSIARSTIECNKYLLKANEAVMHEQKQTIADLKRSNNYIEFDIED